MQLSADSDWLFCKALEILNNSATTLHRADVVEKVVKLQDVAQRLRHARQQVLELGQQPYDDSDMAVLPAVSRALSAELEAAVSDMFTVMEQRPL